jgi:hypothetical protein
MIPGGKILGPTPNLVNPVSVTAEKVANIASPASATSMWDKLAAKQGVPSTAPKMAGGMTALGAGTYGTSKLQHLSTQLANNDRYKNPLPNTMGRPQQGIASAMQEVAGGRGAGANKGNTVFVDDANWPVTLKEIIGSRMLTQQQLQAASIDNVKKLFTTGLNSGRHQGSLSVGTSKEHEELYYMAQRMIIEGMVRGVDITKAIKERGGLNIAIRNVSFNKNADGNIGLHSTGPSGSSINFNARHWRKMSEMEKYTLFMHEMGHGLLWQPEKDRSAYGIMGDGPYGVAKKLMSSKEAYNSILNYHFSSRGQKGLTAIAKTEAGKGTSDFDPAWFPQLSGEQVKIDGGNYDPGSSSGNAADPEKDYTKDFEGVNSRFDAISKMLESQNAQMAQQAAMMEQQQEMMQIQSVDTTIDPSSVDSVSLSAPQTAGGGGGGMGGAMGGAIDTTGFAQQLQALGSGGLGQGGNLLSSG